MFITHVPGLAAGNSELEPVWVVLLPSNAVRPVLLDGTALNIKPPADVVEADVNRPPATPKAPAADDEDG